MAENHSHWKEHYQVQHQQIGSAGSAKSQDYSNERVQLQTYTHVWEGIGALQKKKVLDVGCGWGSFSLMLSACGADVTAVDFIPDTIGELSLRYPFIHWEVIDFTENTAADHLPLFDCIVAIEV